MKQFGQWLVESFAGKSKIDEAIRVISTGIDRFDKIRIMPDYSDKTKCVLFKNAHSSILGKVVTSCEFAIKELKLLSLRFAEIEIQKLIEDLKAKYKNAKDNEDKSLDPGGCGIPSAYTSLKNPGVAEKIRELPRLINILIRELQELDFTPEPSASSSKKKDDEENGGWYTKLFGKKGLLNPDRFARPVKRPEKNRLPKL